MRVHREFTLATAADEVFAIFSAGERIAACVPGAELHGRDGDGAVTGALRADVGAISADFRGRLTVLDVDGTQRRAVLKARGSDARGRGDAEALVTVAVRPDGEGSLVTLDADLRLRGLVAEQARGSGERLGERLTEELARGLAGLTGHASRDDDTAAAGLDARPVAAPAATDLRRQLPAAAALWLLGALYGYLAGRLRGAER